MKRIFLFSCFLFSILVSNAQIITTVAGTNSDSSLGGYNGDGIIAKSAKLYQPQGIALDRYGNIFLADQGNSRIRRIDAKTKIITTIAGNGNWGYSGDNSLAVNATLRGPTGVCLDGNGNIYIADTYNSRIRKVDVQTGVITTIAGNGLRGISGDDSLATKARLYRPNYIAVDKDGNVYFTDSLCVRMVNTQTGIIKTVAGTHLQGNLGDTLLAVNSHLNDPRGIAVDKSGNFYFADITCIKKVDGQTGVINTILNFINNSYCSGVFLDSADNLFITDMAGEVIRKYDTKSRTISIIAGTGKYGYLPVDSLTAIYADLNSPFDVAVDVSGNVYFSDNYDILEIIHNPICDHFHLKPITVLDPSTLKSCDGSIVMSLNGGNGPYRFIFNSKDTVNNSTASFGNLCAAVYNISVSDSNGCATDTSITLAPIYNCVNSTLKVGVSKYAVPTNKLCNGKLSASAIGGRAPYTYHWSDGFKGAQDSTLCALKSYTVTAIDSIGCAATAQFTTGNDSITLPCKGFSVNITAPNQLSGCFGSATANVVAGTAPYLYSWSNYYNTSSIDNICPGMYSVQVYDSNFCYTTASINIAADTTFSPTPLSLYINTSFASTPSTCNGVAVASADGGVPPYKFSFSNKNSYLNYDSLLCSGVYQVTVSDKKGAQATMSFVISNPMNSFGDSTTQYTDSFAIATPNASAATNCLVNYPTVDSVAIINYQMIGAGHDSVLITWAIFSGQTYTPIGMKYAIGKSGVYDFVLQIYCGPTITAKMNANVVNGYLTAHEKYYINTSATGITSTGPSGNASSIYPVPFTSNLTVRFGNPDRYNITIMDLTGKTVINPIMNNTNPECMINLTNLEAGVYMVKVQSSKGGVEFFKVIKN